MTLTIDILELDAMKHGARVQVLLRKRGIFYGDDEVVWEFELEPDSTSYIAETKEVEIGKNCKEVILEVYIEDKIC